MKKISLLFIHFACIVCTEQSHTTETITKEFETIFAALENPTLDELIEDDEIGLLDEIMISSKKPTRRGLSFMFQPATEKQEIQTKRRNRFYPLFSAQDLLRLSETVLRAGDTIIIKTPSQQCPELTYCVGAPGRENKQLSPGSLVKHVLQAGTVFLYSSYDHYDIDPRNPTTPASKFVNIVNEFKLSVEPRSVEPRK